MSSAEHLDENSLAAFLSAALTPTERASAEAHLDQCPACAQLFADVVRLLPSDKDATTVLTRSTGNASLSDSCAPPPQAGERVGRFLLMDELGAGGMGVVYAAHDPQLDRRVALKILAPAAGGTTGPASQARLLREAQAMARLSHPNVVPVYEAGTDQGRIFLVMEYVEGVSLRRWLTTGQRTEREILDVFIQAGRGLQAAHAAGLVHGDFKPENVMVGLDGRARVTDFGLARDLGTADTVEMGTESPKPDHVTRKSFLMGTPRYMAPEQYRREIVDSRADQFSFCVALFEALWREAPFAGATEDAVVLAKLTGRISEPPKVGASATSLRSVVTKGLSATANQRFERMEALLSALERARRARSLPARGLAVAAAVALAGLIGASVHLARQDKPSAPAALRAQGVLPVAIVPAPPPLSAPAPQSETKPKAEPSPPKAAPFVARVKAPAPARKGSCET